MSSYYCIPTDQTPSDIGLLAVWNEVPKWELLLNLGVSLTDVDSLRQKGKEGIEALRIWRSGRCKGFPPTWTSLLNAVERVEGPLVRQSLLMWVLSRPGHSVSEVNVCSPYPLRCCLGSGCTPLSLYICVHCTSVCSVHLCVVYICIIIACTHACPDILLLPCTQRQPLPYPLRPIWTVHYMQSWSPHMKYTSAMSLCGLMGWPTSPPLLIL